MAETETRVEDQHEWTATLTCAAAGVASGQTVSVCCLRCGCEKTISLEEYAAEVRRETLEGAAHEVEVFLRTDKYGVSANIPSVIRALIDKSDPGNGVG